MSRWSGTYEAVEEEHGVRGDGRGWFFAKVDVGCQCPGGGQPGRRQVDGRYTRSRALGWLPRRCCTSRIHLYTASEALPAVNLSASALKGRPPLPPSPEAGRGERTGKGTGERRTRTGESTNPRRGNHVYGLRLAKQHVDAGGSPRRGDCGTSSRLSSDTPCRAGRRRPCHESSRRSLEGLKHKPAWNTKPCGGKGHGWANT